MTDESNSPPVPEDFPSNTKVVVTGADGFIGSHVVESLVGVGASVNAFCMYNSNGSLGWLDESSIFSTAVREGQASFTLGDIRDPEHVLSVVSEADIVLHLAALIAIPFSYAAPRSYVETNVIGTLNVLEAVRRTGVARMVHTSTSEVYGTPREVPITESHPLRAQSPYAASKIAADKMCESYALSFETPVTILRPFNTFGPRQSTRAVIPTILSQMLGGLPSIRLGAVSPQRDFTFVTDTAAGFLRAARADVPAGTTIQLGTGRAVSVGDLVELCRTVTGSDAEIVTDEQRFRPKDSEVEILLSDPSTARDSLGWAPSVSLEQGLQATSQWLSSHLRDELLERYHQ